MPTAVKPKPPKTLSGKLRQAEALVDSLCLTGAPQEVILRAYWGNPDNRRDPGENGLRERMEKANRDPLVAIMRSLSRKGCYRRLWGPDSGAIAYNGPRA
jgi:hypothetical protein